MVRPTGRKKHGCSLGSYPQSMTRVLSVRLFTWPLHHSFMMHVTMATLVFSFVSLWLLRNSPFWGQSLWKSRRRTRQLRQNVESWRRRSRRGDLWDTGVTTCLGGDGWRNASKTARQITSWGHWPMAPEYWWQYTCDILWYLVQKDFKKNFKKKNDVQNQLK